jgi:hypothetical protein
LQIESNPWLQKIKIQAKNNIELTLAGNKTPTDGLTKKTHLV